MKKLFTLLAIMMMAVTSAWADDPDYLCFTAEEATSVAFKNRMPMFAFDATLQYQTETSGTKSAWTDYSFTDGDENHTISLAVGDKVYFKATSTNTTFNSLMNFIQFTSTGKVAASGNIMSLLDATCESKTVPEYAFNNLFGGCTSLTEAPELPATSLASYCYNNMFSGCTSLTKAPELPATTLAESCYEYMFSGCTSLTEAPELPATTLAESCYYYMFSGCTSLKTAPALKATTLAGDCYSGMFQGCTSLTTAPALPATELASSCYYQMFKGCTSLTTAPALPATSLASYCYQEMFNGCTSLAAAPELKATELARNCCQQMFQGCTSLKTAPELKAETLAYSCYYQMFQGCTSLTTAPELKATTLADWCYSYMFDGCTSLKVNTDVSTTAPGIEWKINATSVGEGALKNMFASTGGTLTGAPTNGTTYYIASLPAVQLNSKGYATYSSAQNVDIETAGVKAYTATASGSTITLNAIGSDKYIPAGVGVVLYGEDMANKVVTFKTPVNTTAASTTDNALKSTLVAGSTTGAYKVDAKPTTGFTFALGDGSTFLHYTGTSFIANRAYFNLDTDPAPASEAKALTIVFGDETTAINNVDVDANQAREGKYLENGHIMIIKNGKKFNANGQQIK